MGERFVTGGVKPGTYVPTKGAYPGATLLVAASNSTARAKTQADYTCTGTADDATILSAINALPSGGGRLLFAEGDYYTGITSGSGIIFSKVSVTLEGTGNRGGVNIHAPASFAGVAILKSTGNYVNILNLSFVYDNPAGCTGHGIWTTGNVPEIRHCTVMSAAANGIMIDSPLAGDVYNALVDDCLVGLAGSGVLGDGIVATSTVFDSLFTRNNILGGTALANGLLTSSLTSGSVYTSLAVAALTGPISSGDTLVICQPSSTATSQTQLVTASAGAASGATSVSVNSFTANANYTASFAVVADQSLMVTRNGLVDESTNSNWTDNHPYYCYENGLWGFGAFNIAVHGGSFENCGWSGLRLSNFSKGLISGVNAYGVNSWASIDLEDVQESTVFGCRVGGGPVTPCGIYANGCSGLVIADNAVAEMAVRSIAVSFGTNVDVHDNVCSHLVTNNSFPDLRLYGQTDSAMHHNICNGISEENTSNNNVIEQNLLTGGTVTTVGANTVVIPFGAGTPPNPASVLGLVSWNFDPDGCSSSGQVVSGGVLYMHQIWVPANTPITGIALSVGTIASGVTANENFVLLVDSAGNRHGISTAGVMDTIITSTGLQKIPFSAQYTLTGGPGQYMWACWYTNATTEPILAHGTAGPTTEKAAAPFRHSRTTASFTTPPPTSQSPSTGTVATFGFWCGIY